MVEFVSSFFGLIGEAFILPGDKLIPLGWGFIAAIFLICLTVWIIGSLSRRSSR